MNLILFGIIAITIYSIYSGLLRRYQLTSLLKVAIYIGLLMRYQLTSSSRITNHLLLACQAIDIGFPNFIIRQLCRWLHVSLTTSHLSLFWYLYHHLQAFTSAVLLDFILVSRAFEAHTHSSLQTIILRVLCHIQVSIRTNFNFSSFRLVCIVNSVIL